MPAAAQELDPSAIGPGNWYWGPANRWSWHNTRRIFPTARVSRGEGAVVPLTHSDQTLKHDLDTVTFKDPVTQKKMTVSEMLDSTYTDGFLVLHHGQMIAESYRNGLTPDEPHLLMSVSKSIMGTLAGILVGQGKLDANKLVTDYVPEMKNTLYEGATVRNLLDMSVEDPIGRQLAKTAAGTASEYQAVDEAGGWLPVTKTSAPGLRAYLTGLHRPHGQDGIQFQYLDQSAILIGWVMERATGRDLSEILTSELWTKLGAEQDAYVLLDHYQQAYSSAGFNATLRDLGRFGAMMAAGGKWNGQQIVPEAWIEDIRTNGQSSGGKNHVSPAAPAPWPGHDAGTYRDFWWEAEKSCGRYTGVGLGGQLLVIDPVADVVVVKFDSVPTPELDDKVFQTEYQGIDAVIKAVSGHSCHRD
jgi:CubicO group peptidase (beta-lactamase class C family)